MEQADRIAIGAGAGLSASAGLTYSGQRFTQLFGDFQARYNIQDMYSGGFYPFETLEEYWAWWSRHIMANRYERAPGTAYTNLLKLVEGKDYFVLTTNVDHQFQLAGFDEKRLFCTQGDYGLWQCSEPCHQETYDNEAVVRQMRTQQRDMRIPTWLIPRCPKCGRPMSMNLRCDDTFVQDAGWYAAARRYEDFIRRCRGEHVLFLELGVGMNTPGIIKYHFWQQVKANQKARYICINRGQAYAPPAIARRSLCLDADIGLLLQAAADRPCPHGPVPQPDRGILPDAEAADQAV